MGENDWCKIKSIEEVLKQQSKAGKVGLIVCYFISTRNMEEWAFRWARLIWRSDYKRMQLIWCVYVFHVYIQKNAVHLWENL